MKKTSLTFKQCVSAIRVKTADFLRNRTFRYVLKRLLIALFVLLIVSMILYLLVRLIPVSFVQDKINSQSAQGVVTDEHIQKMNEIYGLADNSFFGIIKGYFNWLGNVLHGNFGDSFLYTDPVSTVISRNMGLSFAIAFVALILQYIIAIPLGIKTAVNQYGKLDYTATVFAMLGISLPSFFLSTLLIKFLAVDLRIFPTQGFGNAAYDWTGDPTGKFFNELYYLILPMTVMVILSIGGTMRYTRTNTLEVLNTDYIRTARAKGVSERSVIYKHAFRNTTVPLVTMMAGILPGLFGGAMIIEEVFSIPGIGMLAYRALKVGDIPFIMGYNMFLAVLTVLGTLFSDLMYAVVDPRVKLSR